MTLYLVGLLNLRDKVESCQKFTTDKVKSQIRSLVAEFTLRMFSSSITHTEDRILYYVLAKGHRPLQAKTTDVTPSMPFSKPSAYLKISFYYSRYPRSYVFALASHKRYCRYQILNDSCNII